MVLFFYGTETLQPEEKIRALVAKYVAKNVAGAGLSKIDCADGASLRDVCDALFCSSLFTQRRLVVVRNPFTLPAADQRALAEKVDDIAAEDVVVFWEQGAPRTNAVLFKKLLAGAHTAKEYVVPTGQAYLTWIARRLDSIVPGTTIARSAATELIQRIGADLVRMHQVLMQCAAHVDGGRVTHDVVCLFAAPRAEANAFRAVESLMSGNRVHALKLLSEQMRAGEDAFKLFGLYAYHVRSLLAVADCAVRGMQDRSAIATETGLKPFVVRKALDAVRTIPLAQLANAHARLVKLDAQVKSGVVTMEEALYDFVARIEG